MKLFKNGDVVIVSTQLGYSQAKVCKVRNIKGHIFYDVKWKLLDDSFNGALRTFLEPKYLSAANA